MLALYLLLLRDDTLQRGERFGLVRLVAFAAATHSATLAVLLALTASRRSSSRSSGRKRFRGRVASARLAALVLGAIMVFASDAAVTKRIAWPPGGFALSFGRMLQDGIVDRYLADHCPDPSLRLCAYKAALPRDPDVLFWDQHSIFNKLGRFKGMHDEMRRIATESLADYPLLQLKSVITETAEQLHRVRTGAGVVSWVWDTYFTIDKIAPKAVPPMKAARQQRGLLSFDAINLLHVPLAWLAMVLLPAIGWLEWRRAGFTELATLAASVTLAILGNAAVFGVLATAHDRYGARIVWLAGLTCMIALARGVANPAVRDKP